LPVDTFRDGCEFNPYGPNVDARLHRLSAVPASEYNSWALGAIPRDRERHYRRRKAVGGAAWVPQHALTADRRRSVALISATAAWIALLAIVGQGVETAKLLILPAALLLLLARGIVQRLRVHADYHIPTGQVGIVSRNKDRKDRFFAAGKASADRGHL